MSRANCKFLNSKKLWSVIAVAISLFTVVTIASPMVARAFTDPTPNFAERLAAEAPAIPQWLIEPARWGNAVLGGTVDAVKNIAACSSDSGFDFVKCVLAPLVVNISTLLISISAWLLYLAGTLFNWLVDNTILLFGSSINEYVKPGIDVGWTALRNVANIIIIGMFVFMAIMTILGNADYGYKKLLSRVLIIAILVNFSLLFTKMVIDASNFTASQIYAATHQTNLGTAVANAQNSTGAINTTNPDSQLLGGGGSVGIASAFIGYLGVTSVGDVSRALGTIATNNGLWVVLLHGLLATAFLIGAAIALFYGAYLLLSRALLFIFLMITSAAAFATHLIPAFGKGGKFADYGWDAWWQSLLGNAVFAPILMIMLWVTLKVAEGLSYVNSNASGNSSTLGALISANTASGVDIRALFNYLIILGLLYATFKIARVLAGTIGGFNYAAMVGAIPLAAGARVTGALGRNTLGLSATWAGERLNKKARDAQKEGHAFRARLYDTASQRFMGVGKRDFNPANTAVAGGISDLMKLKKPSALLDGKTNLGGYKGIKTQRESRIGKPPKSVESKQEKEAQKTAAETSAEPIVAAIQQASQAQTAAIQQLAANRVGAPPPAAAAAAHTPAAGAAGAAPQGPPAVAAPAVAVTPAGPAAAPVAQPQAVPPQGGAAGGGAPQGDMAQAAQNIAEATRVASEAQTEAARKMQEAATAHVAAADALRQAATQRPQAAAAGDQHLADIASSLSVLRHHLQDTNARLASIATGIASQGKKDLGSRIAGNMERNRFK